MLQMANNPFVDVRIIMNLLVKLLPRRVYIDIHMINNVCYCAYLQK